MRRRDVRESRTPIRAAAREEELSTLIGYARISTAGEGLDLQKEALDRAGVEELFVDVADAAAVKRPQLERALKRLGEGHILVVWRLDRVGRNLRHLIETVEYLEGRGIGFRSLDENIDTTTVMGKLMFRAFGAALAKFERDLMQEKQLENLRARSRPGARRPGPKPKLDEQKRALAFELHYNQGLSIADVCRRLDISRATFFRALREGPKRKSQPGRKSRAKAVVRSPANRPPRAALSLVRAPVSP